MKVRILVGLVVGTVAFAVGAGVDSAAAQAPAGPPQEKGVTATNLVTSLGGFRGVSSIPVVLTGQVVTIEPGGQTGRQRHSVPSYVYVLEGTLITNSEGGPVGVAGAQYHGEGQSYMDAVNVWHNYSNPGQAPLKYLLLLISTPGASNLTEKAKGDD